MKKATCLSLLSALLLFARCGERTQLPPDTTKEGNQLTTFSGDTALLARYLDLSRFRPRQVRFQRVLIDNSGTGERLSVPGPSDAWLEAALWFDSSTVRALRTAYKSIDYPDPGLQPGQFRFDWLDSATLRQLDASDTTYHGHPDVFFSQRPGARLWITGNIVLLRAAWN